MSQALDIMRYTCFAVCQKRYKRHLIIHLIARFLTDDGQTTDGDEGGGVNK